MEEPRSFEASEEGPSVHSERTDATIGELFPSLLRCSEHALQSNLLDRRAVNALGRRGVTTWGALCELSVGDIWGFPNAGELTVNRILRAANAKAAELLRIPDEFSGPGEPLDHPPSESQVAAAKFIRILAHWARDSLGAATVGDLLQSVRSPLPESLVGPLAEFEALELADVLPADVAPPSNLIIRFLDDLGQDARFVTERYVKNPSQPKPTLKAIADAADLSRERVRQLIKRGLAKAETCREREEYRVLRWRAEELRTSLGDACRVDSSIAQTSVAHSIRGFDEPKLCSTAEFMLWFASGYRRDDKWWISAAYDVPSIKSAIRGALDGAWLLQGSDVSERLASTGPSVVLDDHDIEFFAGWRSIGDGWWLRWDGTVADKAERILRLTLRSMTPSEINERIGDGHALSSVQNVLSSDDRFTRVAKELEYALCEWGWEEYSSVAQEIRERIERCGGEALLNDVVVELFEQFGLKETTVRAYASTPAFVVENGRIRLRSGDDEAAVAERVTYVRGAFRLPERRIAYNVTVDGDILRGSGRPFPDSVAGALGMRPGTERSFNLDHGGVVRLYWSPTNISGATIGSIRGLAERLNATIGDTVRLVFDDQHETIEAVLVSGRALSDLTGLAVTFGNETAEIAEAIEVAPSEVRSALIDRGDHAIAELLPLSTDTAGLDQALERLKRLLG